MGEITLKILPDGRSVLLFFDIPVCTENKKALVLKDKWIFPRSYIRPQSSAKGFSTRNVHGSVNVRQVTIKDDRNRIWYQEVFQRPTSKIESGCFKQNLQVRTKVKHMLK